MTLMSTRTVPGVVGRSSCRQISCPETRSSQNLVRRSTDRWCPPRKSDVGSSPNTPTSWRSPRRPSLHITGSRGRIDETKRAIQAPVVPDVTGASRGRGPVHLSAHRDDDERRTSRYQMSCRVGREAERALVSTISHRWPGMPQIGNRHSRSTSTAVPVQQAAAMTWALMKSQTHRRQASARRGSGDPLTGSVASMWFQSSIADRRSRSLSRCSCFRSSDPPRTLALCFDPNRRKMARRDIVR